MAAAGGLLLRRRVFRLAEPLRCRRRLPGGIPAVRARIMICRGFESHHV
ncbi:hypothetical protein CLOSTASPAR_06459 [[Clostridium] asparagiforme DSM 15981]|uniref:Uncharacterized protein n=1 Tax=[Clostridium] asparagiforme DSM 15981 TaxID=518636 RepID=C0DB04_9FIRM|nr:hypothetical protein CLOSTASPAR_06459 [[Clostridium] asparagiforme DSM 15981]